MSVRLRRNPATLAARLPVMAAGVDAGLSVPEARSLGEWIWQRDRWAVAPVAVSAGVSALVLFLSAMGLFVLMSIGVSRRTREIGLRVALGANPRHVLARIVAHAMVLLGSGVTAGGGLVLLSVALGLNHAERHVRGQTSRVRAIRSARDVATSASGATEC